MKLTEPVDWPEGWAVLDDDLMSNFDHAVDEHIAAELKTVQAVASYTAFNFHAMCWWDGSQGVYMAAVSRYRTLRATFAASTPQQLMTEISNEFGYE